MNPPKIDPVSVKRVAHAMLKRVAFEDPSWFAGKLDAASSLLEDAVATADTRGGLSDTYGPVAKATKDIRQNVTRTLSQHANAIRRLGRRAAAPLTIRQVKNLMRKHGLPGVVSGRGTDWELEVKNDRERSKVEGHVQGLGGYRTGFGGWVLSQDYQSKGDWNDSSSRHHYASGNGWETLRLLVDYGKLTRVHRSLSGADDQAADLLHEVWSKVGDELDISRGAQEAFGRLRQIAENGERWDSALLRNNIFKAAHSLGLRLPSAMFASRSAGTRLNNSRAAKVGDLIQSFDVIGPPDTSRGSLIGRVTKVEKDRQDGVEYVYYTPLATLRAGVATATRSTGSRAPQNGTPLGRGGVADGIHIIS